FMVFGKPGALPPSTSQNEKNNKAQGSGNGGSDTKPNSGNSTGRGAMAVDIDQGLIDIAAVEEKQSQELRSLTLATACPPSTCKVEMAGEKFDALVDSGSALALISEDLATRLDLRRRVIAPLRAVFANKQTQLITEETIVPCRVGDKQLILPFLIASGLSYDLILGRSALRLCGAKLVYRFDDTIALEKIQSELLEASKDPKDSRNRSEPSPRERNGAYEFSEISLVDIINPERIDCSNVTLQGKIICSVSGDDLAVTEAPDSEIEEQSSEESESEPDSWMPSTIPHSNSKSEWENCDSIEQCLEKLVKCDWRPIRNAEAYKIKLVELGDDDVRDTASQRFRFLVNWEEKKSESDRRSWSPNRLLQKLSPEQYQLWLDELEMYENRHWWERVPKEEVPRETATAFPIISMGKTTRVRPVVDARVLNCRAPIASSKKHSVGRLTQQLRSLISPGVEVRQYDLAKAFYRLAVVKPVYIDYGKGIVMRTSRLAFGLAIGPGALESALDIIWSILDRFFPSVRTLRMMDDIIVVSSLSKLVEFEKMLYRLLNLVGFDIPEEKKTIWSTEYSKWLGAHWAWDGSVLRMKPPVINSIVSTTKREVFRQAGRFIDLCQSLEEVQARAHCDWARRKEVNRHLDAAVESWARISTEVPLFSAVKSLYGTLPYILIPQELQFRVL
ncbi:hypothetical protein FOZ61_001147, partial [Perkinsus olseni]